MNPAVLLQHRKLAYGERCILDDVSFRVFEREFFIIIGPNGSGNSSETMKEQRSSWFPTISTWQLCMPIVCCS
jgi:ABC-type transporter Mla maintaining outer membrane lipid asymmetry ATPase subunit MlaF